ncbi:MAG: type II secretion system protein GspE [Actinobacteria bacterium]|nr:MAG: type II secretion system protein GspE [Actinomycetota bacterium]
MLLEAGLITEEQLKAALESTNGRSLSRVLVDLGFVSEADIASTLAEKMHLQFVDLSQADIDPRAVTMISEDMAQKYNVLPIGFEDDNIVVAMSDPANIFAIDDLRIVTGHDVKPIVATESDLASQLSKLTQMDKSVEQIVETATEEGEVSPAGQESEEDEEADNAPIVKLVNLIITEGARERAGDIHIEPQEKDVRIRFRIDGVLHEIMRSPKKVQNGIVSRLKILAGMDIAERRVPQDGRFGVTIDSRSIDFRVATLPTIHGEKVVLRLLEKENVLLTLDELGFLPQTLDRFRSSFSKPYGAILVTGPTGSGKTTTLYGALAILNVPEKNVITVEDPVEYRLPGLNQVQVNVRAGMTFAAGLRSILRHDPDIVMIGEIRDQETALIAVESALTGHLVLSTLHTNGAAAALTRLTEMGVEPFLTSSAVDCVVAQRLARRLCKDCKEEYEPEHEALRKTGFPLEDGKQPKLYRARGCKKCNNTGYRGRVGIYETLLVSETIERLTVERATSDEIHKVAVEEGMITLRQDGFEKVRQGVTCIEEIVRVLV